MSRISNKTKYPINKEVSLSDYLVGTRSSDKTTLNFEIQNFLNTINEANGISTSQFKFSLDEDIHLTETGFISTNASELIPANVTLLRFSTEDLSGNDLTTLLSSINTNKLGTLIKLSDPSNPNSVIVFEVTGISTVVPQYIDLSVTIYNSFSTVSFVEDTIYSFDYYIFQETGIKNVVEDLTPELGGDLDALNQDINNVKELGFQSGQKLSWNTKYHTINIPTGDGAVSKSGIDTMFDVHNATGGLLTKGTVVYPDGTSTLGISNVQKCIANSHETIETLIGVIAEDIIDGADGHVMIQGVLDPIDTSLLSEGAVYLSDTVAGKLTSVKPEFINYEVLLGYVDSSAVEGVITIDINFNLQNTLTNTWDGSFRESIDFFVNSDGATITGTLEQSGGGNLTMLFSDGFTTLDCTPPQTVTLTQGTSTNPQINYIYIPQATKLLTASTSGFPTEEHIKVADTYVQSATILQTKGALVNRNWNDHVKKVGDNGHLTHISERIRQNNAEWDSGVQGTCTVSAPTLSNVHVSTTSGFIYQLHKQSFLPSDSSSGDDIHIVNNFASPFVTVSNLNTQTLDALGASLLNSSFSFVLWGVQNKTGESSHLMINLPTGTYGKNSPDLAVSDAFNYSVYDIPKPFKGKGFLISRFTFILEPDGTSWTLHDTEDLRGNSPNVAAGGGAGGTGVTEFTSLTDTPSSYLGQASKVLKVNIGETAIEFTDEIISNSADTFVSTAKVTQMVTLTQAEYDGITPSASIMYIII